MSKQIIIEIDQDGNPSIEGRGFNGPECTKFIEEISNALGSVKTNRTNREYTQINRNSNRNIQRQR